jgi:hypothetical protein
MNTPLLAVGMAAKLFVWYSLDEPKATKIQRIL